MQNALWVLVHRDTGGPLSALMWMFGHREVWSSTGVAEPTGYTLVVNGYELRSPPQTLKSHASASSAPPPKAKPFTTATVGMGSACSMTVLSGFHSSLSKREESITHRLAGRQDRAWTALKACLSSLTNSEVSF